MFYGVFVKNFFESMKVQGAEIEKVVIYGRGVGVFDKALKYLRYFNASFRAIYRDDYDVIYVHSASLALLPVTFFKIFIKKPVVVNIHGGDVMDSAPFNRIIFNINSKLIRGADLLVIPSYNFEATVLKTIKPNETFVSPSGGVDRGIFKPLVEKQCKAETLHIGYISRIDPEKGWDTFLTALFYLRNTMPSIKIGATLVGTGSENHEMFSMIAAYGLEKDITYIEQLPQDELPSVYSRFDLFVFPSRRQSESLGLVGIEAMSCGVPVIASRIAGIQDYIEHGVNGFVFQPGDAENLCDMVCHYLSLTSKEKKELIIGAIATAERYDSIKTSSELFFRIARTISDKKYV